MRWVWTLSVCTMPHCVCALASDSLLGFVDANDGMHTVSLSLHSVPMSHSHNVVLVWPRHSTHGSAALVMHWLLRTNQTCAETPVQRVASCESHLAPPPKVHLVSCSSANPGLLYTHAPFEMNLISLPCLSTVCSSFTINCFKQMLSSWHGWHRNHKWLFRACHIKQWILVLGAILSNPHCAWHPSKNVQYQKLAPESC